MSDPATTRGLLARYYEAFNARDISGMLDCLHEDVAHDVNEGKREIGKEAFKQFLIHMNRCYRERLDAIEIMRRHRVGCLPVVEDDQLVGIVTERDFIEACGLRYQEPWERR